MSSIIDYISSWWVTPKIDSTNSLDNDMSQTPVKSEHEAVYLVSVSDLLSVKLKPPKDIIPAPARNMPHITKFQLNMLNQAQLKAILSVKLKHVEQSYKPKVYTPRHPVLKELLVRRPTIH